MTTPSEWYDELSQDQPSSAVVSPAAEPAADAESAAPPTGTATAPATDQPGGEAAANGGVGTRPKKGRGVTRGGGGVDFSVPAGATAGADGPAAVTPSAGAGAPVASPAGSSAASPLP